MLIESLCRLATLPLFNLDWHERALKISIDCIGNVYCFLKVAELEDIILVLDWQLNTLGVAGVTLMLFQSYLSALAGKGVHAIPTGGLDVSIHANKGVDVRNGDVMA